MFILRNTNNVYTYINYVYIIYEISAIDIEYFFSEVMWKISPNKELLWCSGLNNHCIIRWDIWRHFKYISNHKFTFHPECIIFLMRLCTYSIDAYIKKKYLKQKSNIIATTVSPCDQRSLLKLP